MNAKHWKVNVSVIGIAATMFLAVGCDEKAVVEPEKKQSTPDKLPYWGEPDIVFSSDKNGAVIADTVQYTIPKFSFVNQDSAEVSHHTYDGKIFVADFFFTECTTICPMLSAQMTRVQSALKQEKLNDKVMLLSHSVNPLNDTPAVLKAYADKLGADYSNWNFVTGKPEDIYYQAEDGYMLTAFPSDTAQGGIFHTDKLTLVDWNMHIRGYYDGTSTAAVDEMLADIKKLVEEQKQAKNEN